MIANKIFRATPLVILGAISLISAAGCGPLDSGARATDVRRYQLAGGVLRVDISEATLTIVQNSGPGVVVEQHLSGNATKRSNHSISLVGDTLHLSVDCSGLSIGCGENATVRVPRGMGLNIHDNGGPVTVKAIGGDIVARASNDGTLRIVAPGGNLNLGSGGGNITVTQARSAVVIAHTSADANISLGFAASPQHVTADASGSVLVQLPRGSATYLITGKTGGNAHSDPHSSNTIALSSGAQDARVDVAG